LCLKASSGFTSGTTSGTSLSILQAEELSITNTPSFAANGAYFKLVPPPAEKRAISISLFLKLFSFNSSTIYSFPLKFIFFPALLLLAKRSKSVIPKSLSSNTFKKVPPTKPVAPTIATLIFLSSYNENSSATKFTAFSIFSLSILQEILISEVVT